MGDLLRSESMTLLQFVIPSDDAHDVIFELGNLGVIQFKDLNPDMNAFQRNFVNEIRRIDDLERKLRFFEDLLKKSGREIPEYYLHTHPRREKPLSPHEIPELESDFEETERELLQMTEASEGIAMNIKTFQEHVQVLNKYDDFVREYETEGKILAVNRKGVEGCGRDVEGMWKGCGRDVEGMWKGVESLRTMEGRREG
jgi:V-type H+-transporting ATPase subunit a